MSHLFSLRFPSRRRGLLQTQSGIDGSYVGLAISRYVSFDGSRFGSRPTFGEVPV